MEKAACTPATSFAPWRLASPRLVSPGLASPRLVSPRLASLGSKGYCLWYTPNRRSEFDCSAPGRPRRQRGRLMNLRWDRDGDEDGIVLPPFDPAQPMREVYARCQAEPPDEDRGAESGQNRGFPVETTLGPPTDNLHILGVDRPAERRAEVSNAGADQLLRTGRATAIRPLLGASVNLCLRVDRLAGEGFSVSSYFLRNPLLAEELVAWTLIGVDKPIRLESAA